MLENRQVQPADDDAELCEPSPQEVYGFLPNRMADELLLEEAGEVGINGKSLLTAIVDSYRINGISPVIESALSLLVERVGSRPDAIQYWVDHHE